MNADEERDKEGKEQKPFGCTESLLFFSLHSVFYLRSSAFICGSPLLRRHLL
jgi:hypothetical protein